MKSKPVYFLLWLTVCVGAAFPALAQSICPQGMAPFTDTRTGQLVCLPQQQALACPANMVLSTDPRTNQPICISTTNSYTPPANNDPYTTVTPGSSSAVFQSIDAQKAQAQTIELQQQYATEQSNNDFFATVETPSRAREKYRLEIPQDKMASGFVLQAGLGYILIADGIFNVSFGYTFDIPIFADYIRFGIFTDLGLLFGYSPEFGVTWTILPKLIFHKGIFQFSLGLGLGLIWGVYPSVLIYEHYTDYEERIGDLTLFMGKLSFEFDWFLTKDWFVGGVMEIPFGGGPEQEYEEYAYPYNTVYYTPRFITWDIYFHFGYKF